MIMATAAAVVLFAALRTHAAEVIDVPSLLTSHQMEVKRRNVLLLVADDLRPQLNRAYGQSYMVTPNLDKFADTALTFDRAYTNFAICSPSRNSFMTGRLPDKTRVWNFINHFRQSGLSASNGAHGSTWLTLPGFFKSFNYTTLGAGKLYHGSRPPWNDAGDGGHGGNASDPSTSWSSEQDYVLPAAAGCKSEGTFCPGRGKNGYSKDAGQFSDYNSTMGALETLRNYGTQYKTSGKPFFIGMGVHFPHQSWATPEWCLNAYDDPDKLPNVSAATAQSPTNVPDIAFTAELDGMLSMALNASNPLLQPHMPKHLEGNQKYSCPVPGFNHVPEYAQQLLRLGYYTAVTHTDWLFGKMLDTLDELGITNDTVVAVTGDHGYQLGEHSEWGKHTNFELALQVPLLIRAPWKCESIGKHTKTMVELVDLYRTLASLAGLDTRAIPDDVDGVDVSRALDEPSKVVKAEAYSQYSRCPGNRNYNARVHGRPDWYFNNCEGTPAQNISTMGYSVRTQSWRLTEWFRWDGETCSADFASDEMYNAVELYDHRSQKSQYLNFNDESENTNVAYDPANADLLQALRQKLRSRFDLRADLGCPPCDMGWCPQFQPPGQEWRAAAPDVFV